MPIINLSAIDSDAGPAPSSKRSIPWSSQQEEVFSAVEQADTSLEVEAVAGSGKTTTLVEASSRMKGKVAFVAFNKKIADEIKSRTSHLPNVTAGTLHSIGFRHWRNTAPSCIVESKKLDTICDELNVPWNLQSFTKFMVESAKNNAWLHPVAADLLTQAADHFDAWDKLPDSFNFASGQDPFEWVNLVLAESIARSDDVIDFSDMLYMPLCYGTITPEYEWVLVDEAQDTNSTRRALVGRIALPTARIVAVGDRHQSIYGFTGADCDAMDLIATQFSCKYLPLTVTYRCPRRVVEHAHQWVSHIEAAPTAPEGIVRSVDAREMYDVLLTDGSNFTASDAILCRNTKPIVSLALTMIRRGIGARVEGREIGQSLISLTNRWKTVTTLPKLIDKLEDYRYAEAKKFQARGQGGKAAALNDKIDSLIAVIDSLAPKSDVLMLRSRISSLFGDTEPGQAPRVCTLSTIHKSKGREWDRVYLLGREQLQPSKWAKQDWELQQEANLCYVAVTRTKRELVEVEYDGV